MLRQACQSQGASGTIGPSFFIETLVVASKEMGKKTTLKIANL